jgi:hypothetical protein
MAADPNARHAGTTTEGRTTERRAEPRHRILQRCLVRPTVGSGTVSWKGIAFDIATTGIGVALPYPLAIGTTLVIEPQGLPDARTLEARVARFAPVSHLWFCGCELASRLSDEELQAWLGDAARQRVIPAEPCSVGS